VYFIIQAGNNDFFNHRGEVSMTQAQKFADEAIFILQLNSKDAVKYIQRNAGCDEKTAQEVFKSTVVPVAA
jgi:hypothetical protein